MRCDSRETAKPEITAEKKTKIKVKWPTYEVRALLTRVVIV